MWIKLCWFPFSFLHRTWGLSAVSGSGAGAGFWVCSFSPSCSEPSLADIEDTCPHICKLFCFFGMALKNIWKPFFLSVTRSLLGELLEKLVEKLFCGGRDGVSAESSIALSERQSSKMEVNKLNKKNGKGTEKRRIRKCKIPTKSSDARNWKESRRRRRKKERKKFCERKVPPGTGSTDSSWCWWQGGRAGLSMFINPRKVKCIEMY